MKRKATISHADICQNYIMDDPYWNISINGKPGHACKFCKEDYDKKDVITIIKESK